MPPSILTVVGARPQFIKAAMVSAALAERGSAREILVHTGQHYDHLMSQVFFEELGLPGPKFNLGCGSAGHGAQTGRMLAGLEEVLLAERPDLVLVYGDTNSTLAGALAAAKLGIPVAHVEAGMRSFNRRMPEEINRVLTDHLASLHLCVNQQAVANLAAEGVVAGVELVGDVMYDAALRFAPLALTRHDPLPDLGLQPGRFILMTCHRAENVDDPHRLSAIAGAAMRIGNTLPVVLPLHPRTKKALAALGISLAAPVRVLEPLGYLPTLALERQAALVVTDSGGMQKEALFHGVPCVTLRGETEWVETVACGGNRLAGGDEDDIVEACGRALAEPMPEVDREALYGGGRAARRVADLLLRAAAGPATP